MVKTPRFSCSLSNRVTPANLCNFKNPEKLLNRNIRLKIMCTGEKQAPAGTGRSDNPADFLLDILH